MPNKTPDPEWDPVYWSNFRSSLFNRSSWDRQANSLLEAAALVEAEVRVIWRHNKEWLREEMQADGENTPCTLKPRATELFAVHFMLIAFALENLLKGALVEREHSQLRDEFEKKGKLPRTLQSHDLFALCRRLGVLLSAEEEDVVRRLTRAAVWAGRYPLPTDFRDTSSAERFSDGKLWSVGHFSEEDPERVARVIAAIRETLRV